MPLASGNSYCENIFHLISFTSLRLSEFLTLESGNLKPRSSLYFKRIFVHFSINLGKMKSNKEFEVLNNALMKIFVQRISEKVLLDVS